MRRCSYSHRTVECIFMEPYLYLRNLQWLRCTWHIASNMSLLQPQISSPLYAFLLNKANSQASSAKKRPRALVPVVICGRLERADFTKKRPALLSSSTKANTWPTGLPLCSLQLVVVAQCGHHCHSLLCVRLPQMRPDAKLNWKDGILHYLVSFGLFLLFFH